MEGIVCTQTKPLGLGQHGNDLLELDNGSWPTVGHEQGTGVGMRTAFMDEMHGSIIDAGGELVQCVEFSNRAEGVKRVLPIGHEGF